MRIPLAVVFCVALAPTLAWGQSDERAAMLSWINADRAADGRPPLAPDRRLDAVADAHARDMAAHRFFSHTSPSTGAPADRAAAAGVTFRLLAENIALNQSVRAAHEALMRSPGHRANLLNGSLRRVGIGLVRGVDGVYVTQLFATYPGDAAGAAPSPVSPAAPDAEVQRWTGTLGRPSARRRADRWTTAPPFELLRVVIPALPSARRGGEGDDDGADDDAPCAR